MSASTSEPAAEPGSSSGLSPQALHEKQNRKQAVAISGGPSQERPVLQRLRRLRDMLPQDGTTATKPLGPHRPRASKCKTEIPCESDTAPPAFEGQLKPNVQAEGAGAGPSRHPASREVSASRMVMLTEGKQAPSKRKGIADAPRQFADPLSIMQASSRKRSRSEVLHLFKGKASAALAQRKHLRPAKLTPSFDINSNNRAEHRQQQFHRGAAKARGCGANAPAAHAAMRSHKPQAYGLDIGLVREEPIHIQEIHQV